MSSSSENDQPEDDLFEVNYYLDLTDEALEGPSLRRPATQQDPPRQADGGDCPDSKNKTADCNKIGYACLGSCRTKSAGRRSLRRSSSSVKVAFKTKTELDILDDGYKWRKYGKKAVKSSPNPRNYYRCSSEGCNVKKRVERHGEDPSFVITTYEGVHNHHVPLSAVTPKSHGVSC